MSRRAKEIVLPTPPALGRMRPRRVHLSQLYSVTSEAAGRRVLLGSVSTAYRETFISGSVGDMRRVRAAVSGPSIRFPDFARDAPLEVAVAAHAARRSESDNVAPGRVRGC